MLRGHAPSVMAILRETTLNMVRTVQQNCRPGVSMGTVARPNGRRPWMLATALP